MGLKSMVAGLGSSLFGNSYRTGVLNDYSVVEKATFTIANLEPDGSFSGCEVIPVQINPSDLVLQHSAPVKTPIVGITNFDQPSLESYSSHDESSSLSMTLYYDFYDEYNARSMSGFLGSMSDFHLENSEYSSLKKLVDFSRSSSLPHVMFKWGSNFEFYGVIEILSPTYRAFSSWGQPLKAEVSITIREEANDPNGIKGKLRAKLKGYETMSKISNTALLGAGLAKR
ncbi:MAG: hypothetical protein ACI4PR_00940 [Acutalibacteraceae bacterium]